MSAVLGWWDWLRELEWVPWGPAEEFNPVLSARAPDLSRALRVIRHAPQPGDPEVVLGSWIARYPAEFSELPPEELVISLVESPGAVDQGARLARAWLRGASPAELQEINPGHEQ